MPDLHFSFTYTEADLLELRKHGKPPASGTGLYLLLFAILVALLYGTPAFLNWLMPSPSVPPEPGIKQYFLWIMPWVYIIGYIYIVARMLVRRAFRAEWESAPSYRMLRTVHLTDDALIEDMLVVNRSYRWSAFVRFKESPNLLLLFISHGSALILPKRALPAGTDLPVLRQWINDHINWLGLDPETLAAKEPDAACPVIIPRLHFTCTVSDLTRARRADAIGLRRLLVVIGLGCAVCIVGFLILIGWIIWKVSTRTSGSFSFSENYTMSWWQCAIGLIGLIAAARLLHARAWWKAKHLHGPQAVDVTETGLRFITRTGSHWIGWGAIQRFRHTATVFVLHLRDGKLWLIPKRAFPTPEAAIQFDTLLYNHVTPTSGFPVIPNP